MSSPKSETNQAPINQEQESEALQQKVEQSTVENVQPEADQQNKTDNADNGNKVLDESSTLNKSSEKTAKKKTKKKSKKEEEITGDVPAAAKEEVKETQPEAEKTENNEEPSEKKPKKKKKKTAEKIEVPATVEGEAPQQEEQAPKPKKKAAKKNPETTLVANIVADAKQEAPKVEPTKQPVEEAPKVEAKATTAAKPKKAKATTEVAKAKEEVAEKKPEVLKPSNSKSNLVKEDPKSPAKTEKPAEQNKVNAKGGDSERVNWKASQPAKSDIKAPESATKKPINLKEQAIASPTKTKSEVVAKNSEKKPETPAGKGKKAELEVDTAKNNNNVPEGFTPSKGGKTPDATKSARKVTVNEPAKEQRSISPRKQVKGADKPRVKSFDAGKTQKVDPNDPFDVRCKVWEIRKKEKLLEEEKKSSRKEIEQCTFNPAINKKALMKANLNGDFLQRNAEWSEKTKASLQHKTEKHLEEVTKSDIKKSKIQPSVGSINRLYEVHRAPNSGNLRAANFELLNQDTAGVQERLHEKLAEINDIYDNISSALKAKSSRNRDDIQRATRPITMDSSRKGQPISYPAKHLVAKIIQPTSTDDVNRLESLKSILISNKKKEPVNKSVTNADAPNSQVYLTETNNAHTMLKSAGKHLEIRGNRYVMVDNNDISGIEKKDLESHDISLNAEIV